MSDRRRGRKGACFPRVHYAESVAWDDTQGDMYGHPLTWEEIAELFEISRERARQICDRGLTAMAHVLRSRSHAELVAKASRTKDRKLKQMAKQLDNPEDRRILWGEQC